MIDRIGPTIDVFEGKRNLEILFAGLPTDKVERWKEIILEDQEKYLMQEALACLGLFTQGKAAKAQASFDQWLKGYLPVLGLPAAAAKQVQDAV